MSNQSSINKMILVSLKHNNITAECGFTVSWDDKCVRVGSIILTRVSHAIKLKNHLVQAMLEKAAV